MSPAFAQKPSGGLLYIFSIAWLTWFRPNFLMPEFVLIFRRDILYIRVFFLKCTHPKPPLPLYPNPTTAHTVR